MATYKELKAQKVELDQLIEEARKAEVGAAIQKIRSLMAEFNISVADLSGKSRETVGKKAGGKVAPKYRDPVSAATWTGRGKAPRWIEGKDRNDFLIG